MGSEVWDPGHARNCPEVSATNQAFPRQKKEGRLRAPRKPRNSRGDESYVGEDRFACRP